MSEFVFLFRSSAAEQREHVGTPERAQQSFEVWMRWIGSLEAGGHLVNRGLPLDAGGKVVRADKVMTDGPFVEVKDLVLGFIVIRAADLAEASTLAAGCPIVAGGGGSVEIRPVSSMP
jgi:hypothetical protein